MRWFGAPGGAPYEHDCEHAATPVGEPCEWCDEPLQLGDAGVLIPCSDGRELACHYECHLRKVVGGVNHLMKRCRCFQCGGFLPPDEPDLTRRQAAIKAVQLWGHQSFLAEVRRRAWH